MPKPLDHAELEKAANDMLQALCSEGTISEGRETIRVGLAAIATRAFEQAAYSTWGGKRIGGDPQIPLSDALAALEAPKETTGG